MYVCMYWMLAPIHSLWLYDCLVILTQNILLKFTSKMKVYNKSCHTHVSVYKSSGSI